MDDGTHFLALSDLDLGGVAINGELLGLRSPNLKAMDEVVMELYGRPVNKALKYDLIMHGGGGIVHPGLEVVTELGDWDPVTGAYRNPSRVTSILNERVLVLGIRNDQRFIRAIPYRQFLRQYAPNGLPPWALTGDLPTLP